VTTAGTVLACLLIPWVHLMTLFCAH